MNPHNHLGHSAATQAFEAHTSLNALAIASSSSSLHPLSSTDTMNTLMAQQQQQQQHHNLGHLPLQQHHHQQHPGPAPVAAAAPKLAAWKPPTTTATNPVSTLVLGNQPPGGPLKVESSDANGPGRPAATMPNLTATTPASVAQSSLNALSSNLSASTQQPARPLSTQSRHWYFRNTFIHTKICFFLQVDCHWLRTWLLGRPRRHLLHDPLCNPRR